MTHNSSGSSVGTSSFGIPGVPQNRHNQPSSIETPKLNDLLRTGKWPNPETPTDRVQPFSPSPHKPSTDRVQHSIPAIDAAIALRDKLLADLKSKTLTDREQPTIQEDGLQEDWFQTDEKQAIAAEERERAIALLRRGLLMLIDTVVNKTGLSIEQVKQLLQQHLNEI